MYSRLDYVTLALRACPYWWTRYERDPQWEPKLLQSYRKVGLRAFSSRLELKAELKALSAAHHGYGGAAVAPPCHWY